MRACRALAGILLLGGALCACTAATETTGIADSPAPEAAASPAPEVMESVAPDFAGSQSGPASGTPPQAARIEPAAPAAASVQPAVRELPLEVERARKVRRFSHDLRRQAAAPRRGQGSEADAMPVTSEAVYREMAQRALQKAWDASPEGRARRRLSRDAGTTGVEAVLHMTPDGTVGTAALLKGSGSPSVDEAVTNIARSLRLPPPPRDCGPVFVLLRL